MTVTVFGLGGYTASGVQGALIGVGAGVVWCAVLGLFVWLVNRTKRLRRALAASTLVAAGAVLFFTVGAGTLEYMLISKAIDTTPEWLATITKGPLAEQDILFFIIFNSLLEAVLVPLAVLLNWGDRRRRLTVVTAALIFYAVRIWTYFYFAPEYFDYADITTTQQLVQSLRSRMTLDYGRIALVLLSAALFFRAAVRPAAPDVPASYTLPPGRPARASLRRRTGEPRQPATRTEALAAAGAGRGRPR
ncbi:MAG TPA: hypothetical protein VFM55_16245 [Micromonosporaceae bacterium]|nr:hypothetical protein [Micromonosporaceae bacterium]